MGTKKKKKKIDKVPPIMRLVRLKCGCICTAPNAIGACYKIYHHDRPEAIHFELHVIGKRAVVTELDQYEVDQILSVIMNLVRAGYESYEFKQKLEKYLGLDKIQRNLRGLP